MSRSKHKLTTHKKNYLTNWSVRQLVRNSTRKPAEARAKEKGRCGLVSDNWSKNSRGTKPKDRKQMAHQQDDSHDHGDHGDGGDHHGEPATKEDWLKYWEQGEDDWEHSIVDQ